MTEEEMSDQIEAPAEIAESAGGMLRAAREQQEMSAADVARSLRLASRQIEALEADDFDRLPGNTFVRGFIRNYARLVHLDPEPVLRAYDAVRPQQPAQEIEAPSRKITFTPESFGPRFKLRQAAISAAVLVLAAGAMYWIFLEKGRQPAVSRETAAEPAQLAAPVAAESAPSQEPAPAPPAPAAETTNPLEMPPPPPVVAAQPSVAPEPSRAPVAAAAEEPGAARIKLAFAGDSWVEIRDGKGKKIFSQLNPAGTEQVVKGTPPFSLVVGNASHVRLTYNGKPVDLAPYVKVEVARLALE